MAPSLPTSRSWPGGTPTASRCGTGGARSARRRERFLLAACGLGCDTVHGDNLVPYLTGQTEKSPRESFLYCNDDQQLTALRYGNWKLVFMEQRVQGTLRIWAEPFVTLRIPNIFNLRTDPYERADITSNTYYDWLLDHAFVFVPAQAKVGEFLSTFKEFPPSQKAGSCSLGDALDKMREGANGGRR